MSAKSRKIIIVQISISICLLFQIPHEVYCQDVISIYIKFWNVYKYLHPDNFLGENDIDSIFFVDIKQLLEKPKRQIINKIIKKRLDNKSSYQDKRGDDQILIATFDNYEIDQLNNNNRQRLSKFLITHSKPSNHFLNFDQYEGQISFKNEKSYVRQFPSVEWRLLGTARYYGAIKYFYPYQNQINPELSVLLKITIDKIISAKNSIDYHLAILGMITSINDSHSTVSSYTLDSLWGFNKLPFIIEPVLDNFIVSKIYHNSETNDLQLGDYVLAINNNNLDEAFTTQNHYLWGSNNSYKRTVFANRAIRSLSRDQLTISIKRNEELINFSLSCLDNNSLTKLPIIEIEKHPNLIIDSILYLNPSMINEMQADLLIKDHPNLKHLIIDLRDYPNWIVPILKNFNIDLNTIFAKYSTPDSLSFGCFSPHKVLRLSNYVTQNGTKQLPQIYLIVGPETKSRGEFTAMAFQSLGSCITFGLQTAGADGDIVRINLPGNISTVFSGILIEYPDGFKCQGNGIKIDYPLDKNHSYKNIPTDLMLDAVLLHIRSNNK